MNLQIRGKRRSSSEAAGGVIEYDSLEAWWLSENIGSDKGLVKVGSEAVSIFIMTTQAGGVRNMEVAMAEVEGKKKLAQVVRKWLFTT